MKIDRAMMQRNSEISFIYQSMPFCKLDTPPFNPNKIKNIKKFIFLLGSLTEMNRKPSKEVAQTQIIESPSLKLLNVIYKIKK